MPPPGTTLSGPTESSPAEPTTAEVEQADREALHDAAETARAAVVQAQAAVQGKLAELKGLEGDIEAQRSTLHASGPQESTGIEARTEQLRQRAQDVADDIQAIVERTEHRITAAVEGAKAEVAAHHHREQQQGAAPAGAVALQQGTAAGSNAEEEVEDLVSDVAQQAAAASAAAVAAAEANEAAAEQAAAELKQKVGAAHYSIHPQHASHVESGAPDTGAAEGEAAATQRVVQSAQQASSAAVDAAKLNQQAATQAVSELKAKLVLEG